MKKREVKLILLCLLFICYFGTNQAFAQSSRFSIDRYVIKGDTLNYRLLHPDYDTLRKYPLVVFLHGAGERGNDNESQLKWGVMNLATDQAMAMHPAFVLAPQCPENDTWFNFKDNDEAKCVQLYNNGPSRTMGMVIDLIQKLVKDYPIDKDRIYITGLSMGGFGTFEAIERYPRLFAAAVPVCGGGDMGKAASIAHIPIWVFHGSEDPVVDSRYSLNMIKALTEAGGHPGFTQYPETGHFAWLAAYSDPLMWEWLFRQRK